MYGEDRDAYRVLWVSLIETDHLKDLDVRGRIILKRILDKNNGEECGLDLPGSGQEQIAGSCEHGNEQKEGNLVTR